MAAQRHASLIDFSEGIICGLVLLGYGLFDIRHRDVVNRAFIQAFELVKAELGEENVYFHMELDESFWSSIDVDYVLRWWVINGMASAEAMGSLYVLKASPEQARLSLSVLDGGEDLYLRAAEALLAYKANPASYTY